ncbi:hypothetical protein I6N96_05180 [Enterococcus sp. BWM-S5]|uniref:3-dehydroquinate synthase domain-containing protein n=1 Tax=Enterococcus larvae TaxID=2794352 RepID=A0ABS4CGJ2_9ENTE|nr:hypothetical protein [Enterococcus larvae]MBP1045662.1 hypothetical protein [Enterococcus larvae]
MEFVYEKKDHQSSVIYGETVASLLKNEPLEERHILLVTNQRYYDLFSDKLIQLFNERQNLDWYICKNDTHCNNFSELEALLTFVAAFPAKEDYLLIGLGNEGVMYLSAFINQTAVLTTELWLLPLSLQALSESLTGNGLIELNHKNALSVPSLATRIVYDQTMIKKDGDRQLIDFLVFIQCGLVCSHEFLRDLYKNFTDRSRLNQQSFNGLMEPMLGYYQKDEAAIHKFGQLFETAFYTVDGGHLLSVYMKSLLGSLLQLVWSQQKNGFSFHIKNFLVWLIRLGYPIEFPEQIFVSDYVQELLTCSEEFGEASCLLDIGVLGDKEFFEAEELIQAVEEYKNLIEKIKRGQ